MLSERIGNNDDDDHNDYGCEDDYYYYGGGDADRADANDGDDDGDVFHVLWKLQVIQKCMPAPSQRLRGSMPWALTGVSHDYRGIRWRVPHQLIKAVPFERKGVKLDSTR